uniref:Uncharacterized protein n=1 Tax=Lactuca sativa TaxID=4236 RepID=A0A9R1V663_LACSA|nr:hypothetical protein LSAT_V11C600329420 [Lactuca sativa]
MSPPLTSYIQSVFFASLSLMLSIDFSFLILDVLPFRREAESDMCRFTIRHCRSRRFYLFSPLSDKGLLPAIFLIVGSQFRSTPPRIADPMLQFSCVSPVKEEEDKIRELPLRATMDDWRANAS